MVERIHTGSRTEREHWIKEAGVHVAEPYGGHAVFTGAFI